MLSTNHPKEPERPRSASIFESPMQENEACKSNTIATQLRLQVGVSWLHPRHKYMDTPRNYCEFWKWNFFVSRRVKFFLSRRYYLDAGRLWRWRWWWRWWTNKRGSNKFSAHSPLTFTLVSPLDHLTTSVNGKWKCLPQGNDDLHYRAEDEVDEKGASWIAGATHQFLLPHIRRAASMKERKKKVNPLEWLTEPQKLFSAPHTPHTHRSQQGVPRFRLPISSTSSAKN